MEVSAATLALASTALAQLDMSALAVNVSLTLVGRMPARMEQRASRKRTQMEEPLTTSASAHLDSWAVIVRRTSTTVSLELAHQLLLVSTLLMVSTVVAHST